MKQMEECLNRFFENKAPLRSKKWKAFSVAKQGSNDHLLALYHYHHLVLVYNLDTNEIEHEWWELPADKRGLDSAKEILAKKLKNQKG